MFLFTDIFRLHAVSKALSCRVEYQGTGKQGEDVTCSSHQKCCEGESDYAFNLNFSHIKQYYL